MTSRSWNSRSASTILAALSMAVRYVRSRDAFALRWDPNPVSLAPAETLAVQAHWRAVLERAPDAFDGPLLVCSSMGAERDGLCLSLGSSSYAPYAWARANDLPRQGLYAVGTGVVVIERATDSFVLLERGTGVVFDRSRVGWIGGVATPPTDPSVDLWAHLQEQSAIELGEELAFDEQDWDASRLRFVGAYLDERTLKLEVLFAATVSRCAMRGEENTRCVRVGLGTLQRWFADNEPRAERSMREHLRHIVAELDRES